MINIDTLYPLAPAAHVAIKKQPFIGLSHCHTPPLVNEVPVIMHVCARSITFPLFCDFSIIFWNCSDRVVI